MKMIAFYNNKGGVGKTSTAINIAYTLYNIQNKRRETEWQEMLMHLLTSAKMR